MLSRLHTDELTLEASRSVLAEAVRLEHVLTAAAEWLPASAAQVSPNPSRRRLRRSVQLRTCPRTGSACQLLAE
jgi:hypothetical protein